MTIDAETTKFFLKLEKVMLDTSFGILGFSTPGEIDSMISSFSELNNDERLENATEEEKRTLRFYAEMLSTYVTIIDRIIVMSQAKINIPVGARASKNQPDTKVH